MQKRRRKGGTGSKEGRRDGGREREREREEKETELYYKIEYETVGITLMFIHICLPATPLSMLLCLSLILGQIILLISGKMHVRPLCNA